MEKTALNKSKYLILRITESQKERWKRLSAERKTTLTDLIISAVEGNMNAQERRELKKQLMNPLVQIVYKTVNQFELSEKSNQTLITMLQGLKRE
ncbi:hypothetical protein ABC973_08870 [Capnocytophaga sputigena]|uniref:hypothetical protein n=1 Tax=Capnocytophaga sputigena TaxID=1019 RepID=UPI0031F541C0